MSVEEKTIIAVRTHDLETIQAREEKLREKINDLAKICERALGTTQIDLSKLVAKPLEYIVSNYKLRYYPERRDDLEWNTIVSNEVNLNTNNVQKLGIEIKNLIEKLGQHAPTITAKRITSNINYEHFNVYLNENKRDEYNALQSVLKALEGYKKNTNRFQPIHFLRGLNGLKFNSDHTFFEIDTYHFGTK